MRKVMVGMTMSLDWFIDDRSGSVGDLGYIFHQKSYRGIMEGCGLNHSLEKGVLSSLQYQQIRLPRILHVI